MLSGYNLQGSKYAIFKSRVMPKETKRKIMTLALGVRNNLIYQLIIMVKSYVASPKPITEPQNVEVQKT